MSAWDIAGYLGAFALALGVLIVVHELGHFWMAKACGVKVLRFSVGFGKPLLMRRFGKDDTEWVLAAFPLGGYVRMLDEQEGDVSSEERHRTFNRQSIARRSLIVAAGPVANLLLAVMLFWGLFSYGIVELRTNLSPIVGQVSPGSAAEVGGIKTADEIVSIDNRTMVAWNDVTEMIQNAPGRSLAMVVLRNGQHQKLTVIPSAVVKKERLIGRLGITVRTHHDPGMIVRYGPLDALGKACQQTGNLSLLTVHMMGRMLTGEISSKNISGPIAIASYAGQSAQAGWVHYLKFLALISISLGILNLLPIPILDGGHLLYYLAEIVRGGPLSERAMEIGQQVGMVLLSLLMAIAFYNDFNRLF